MMNHGIYGEYNVEVVKSGSNESYYPFGTGCQKNLILDEFLGKILSGWRHGPQSWMQTCITNTGTGLPTRFDTTGSFKYGDGPAFNDRTWASSGFITGFVQSENRIFMYRDFTFNPVTTSSRTYREAMVGLFYKNSALGGGGGGGTSTFTPSNLDSDIALSHFVFPENVTVDPGDRLKINYTINFIIDYLSPTGTPIELNGGGYNFDGKIFMRTSDQGIFGYFDNTNMFMTYDYWDGYWNTPSMIYKPIIATGNQYFTSNSSAYNQNSSLFGSRTDYNNVGFWGQNFATGIFPEAYAIASTSGASAAVTRNNFQIDDNGASIDMAYYFPPSASPRASISGILLSRFIPTAFTDREAQQNRSMIYLLFNNRPQTIPAYESISMKLRWYIKRL